MTSSLHRLHIRLLSLRHRLALFLFPPLRRHAQLQNEISAFKIESRRLAAELELAQNRLKSAREEAQTSAITARQSMDRAAQLTIANEQLQSQLTLVMREMADRIERAYGGAANHLALGGQSARRAIYPWIEHDSGPAPATPNLSTPLNKIPGRTAVRNQTAEFLRSAVLNTGDPVMMKAAEEAMQSIQSKLDSGEWTLNGLGQPVPRVETIDRDNQSPRQPSSQPPNQPAGQPVESAEVAG